MKIKKYPKITLPPMKKGKKIEVPATTQAKKDKALVEKYGKPKTKPTPKPKPKSKDKK